MFGLFNGSNTDIMDDIEAVLRPMAGMAIAKKFALHDIVGDVEAVAAVAVGIVQVDGYYLVFHNAGIAVFALRDTRLKQALAAENPARATAVIPEMVATFVLYQQHEAVAEYLRQAGYQIEQSKNGKHIGITAQRNGNVLKADFEDGFFRDLSAQLQK